MTQNNLQSPYNKREDENMKHLTNILTSFAHVAEVPVTFFNAAEKITWDCLSSKKICSLYPHYNDCNKTCIKNLNRALSIAFHLGEPYIFLCNAGLIKIAYPFTVNGEKKGGFFAGPIAMGASHKNAVRRLTKNISLNQEQAPQLIAFLSSLKTRTPAMVSHIYDVFCNSVFSSRILENDFGVISDSAGHLKPHNTEPASEQVYPDDLQDQLLLSIRRGDEDDALKNFRLFYEKVYILESGNLSLVKDRLMELFNVLSRSVTRNNMAVAYYLEELNELHDAFTFSKTFDLSIQLIQKLVKTGSLTSYEGKSSIVKKTIDYVNEYFNQNLSLAAAADAIHTNSSYLSTLFKKEMELTFSQYVTQVRLNHSMKLLTDTHLSMTEIALASGFSDHSYFTKTFKETLGLTPGQYRKQQNTSTYNT